MNSSHKYLASIKQISGVFKFKGSKMEKELDDMYAAGAIGLLSKPKDVYQMSETFQTVVYKIFFAALRLLEA